MVSFRGYTSLVKLVMETSTHSLLMKTSHLHQLCQLQERCGVKADLLRCLEADLPEQNGVPVVGATILDGAAVVQMLNPGTSQTFQEYGERVFTPYIMPNSRRVTASTLSRMYTYLQA